MKKRVLLSVLACLFGSCVSAYAATPKDAEGLWLSQDQKGVIEFKSCKDNATWLCGTIVWDKEGRKGKSTCGLIIAKLKKFDDEAWRDGTAYDPRSKKNYRAVLRIGDDDNRNILKLRAFIGTEALGETEEMTRVTSVPGPCIK